MCFVIDHTRLSSSRQIAWKVVVRRSSGYLYSYWNDKFWYGPGEVRAGVGAYSRMVKAGSLTLRSTFAQAGIYVYTTLLDAERFAKDRNTYEKDEHVILQVEVNPADFLAMSIDCRQSVYSKIFVPEEQPFIEWY